MITDPHGPLAGIRVLDASRVLAGPFCGQVPGDPGAGDETRAWGPPFLGPLSAYYLSCNRNKKALTLDLSRSDGVKLFHELVQRADILLENFRPASAARLGVDPQRLLKINPRLIV